MVEVERSRVALLREARVEVVRRVLALHLRLLAEELGALSEQGPETQEVERSLAQVEAQFVYRLQTVGGFNGCSDQLNAYNVFAGDPAFFDQDRARYGQPAAAKTYMV